MAIPLTRAWSGADGELWFEGVASSTALDRQHERMSRAAISKMARAGRIGLVSGHENGPRSELGVVEECWADNGRFLVRGRFDAGKREARELYDECTAGRRYGLSVGGRVLSARW